MLEFHIDGSIPLIIIDIVKDIVGNVVNDYIMIVFIKNAVVYKHWRILQAKYSLEKLHEYVNRNREKWQIMVNNDRIRKTLEVLADSFQKFLYEDDEKFLENMKSKSLAGDDISRYQHWEWTQGVGLYGILQLFEETGNKDYLDTLEKYYEKEVSLGLPAKNINTVAPMLTLSFLLKESNDSKYMDLCKEWAEAIMHDFVRTEEGGLQHRTSDSENEQELWDDTLFMTVMFLASMGEILDNDEYREEARYQFLLHIKYLVDHTTGLLFHGWTFLEKNNFVNALWGRGNCWFTMAVPESLSIADVQGADRRFLVEALKKQVEALEKYQDESGMWHTLVGRCPGDGRRGR